MRRRKETSTVATVLREGARQMAALATTLEELAPVLAQRQRVNAAIRQRLHEGLDERARLKAFVHAEILPALDREEAALRAELERQEAALRAELERQEAEVRDYLARSALPSPAEETFAWR